MPDFARHVYHTHANLPITMVTTISLTLALLYLQVIYTVSFITSPFWSSNRDFPPFKQTIEGAEKFAIDIILGIVPTSQYRSPAPTNLLHEDAIGQRISNSLHTRALHSSRVTLEPAPRVVSCGSVLVVSPKIPQCYPEPRASYLSPKQNNVQDETMHSIHTERYTKAGDSGASIYGTAQVSSSTRPKLSTAFEMHQQHFSQPSEPGTGPGSVPVNGTGGHATTTVTKQEEHQEEQHTVHIVEIVHPTDSAIALDISHPIAPVMNIPKPQMPMTNSPAVSFDGPGEPGEPDSETGPKPASSSRYTDDSSSLHLDASRAAKTHSTESYPGKFPVSDGMEYSSLATAEYAFRERGTTSVRPFSDY